MAAPSAREEIWVAGAGRFGRLAVERLQGGARNRLLLVVDPSGERVADVGAGAWEAVEADAVTFLADRLSEDRPESWPSWIVPALPVHLAAEWCLRVLGEGLVRRAAVPAELDVHLPNAFRGAGGDVYVSHAMFLCPDDCPEPRDLCTHTGSPRKRDLFRLLAEAPFPGLEPLVVRSHQLAPGVGGYRPRHLLDLLRRVREATGTVLIATACRCHGVVTAVERAGT